LLFFFWERHYAVFHLGAK